MTTRILHATLQKSYYGKATIFEDHDFIVLKSYDTNVVAIDKHENKIVRLWCGYSATTQKHINDFLTQNGFNRLSKKEWLKLPCVNSDEVFNVYISTGFATHKCPALLTEHEAQREITRIRNNDKNGRLYVWYD